MITEYKNDLLTGKPCMVHLDFIPAMDLFCKYLEIVKCKAHINSSFRNDSNHLKDAVVAPAKMSCHFVGHAIDCNLIDSKGKMWSSDEMEVFVRHSPKYDIKISNEILTLLNLVRGSTGLRWGGDFHDFDTVHFDDAINIKYQKRWHELYDEIHNNK